MIRLPGILTRKDIRDSGIERSEALQVAFGMSCRQTRGHDWARGKSGAVPGNALFSAAKRSEEHLVRTLLRPDQTAPVAKDAEAQTILGTDGNLGAPEDTARPARIAQQDMRVVIQCTTGTESVQIGRQGLSLKAGHETRQMKRVGSNVTDRAAISGTFGVRAPLGLFQPLTLDRAGLPARSSVRG